MTMEQTSQGLRTEFLTILCVLSFIGSGIGILSGINNYREADLTAALVREQMQKSRSEIKEKAGEKNGEKGVEMADKVIATAIDATQPDKVRTYSLATVACNALTLLGAFLMFRLRRTGFWIYLLGTLALVVSPFVIYGTGNFLSYAMGLGFGFIGLIFVLLYSRNLKHMS